MDFKILPLDEAMVASLAEAKRPVYIFEWLRFLERALELPSRKGEIRDEHVAFDGLMRNVYLLSFEVREIPTLV